jgi:hypothetical protein
MDNGRLREAVAKYSRRGVIRSTDFLLPPPDAAALVGDLADLGILIVGCDLSRYVNASKTATVELAMAGNVINNRLRSQDTRWNAKVIQAFLAEELPADADLVSFVYADPLVWDLILEYAGGAEGVAHNGRALT